MMKEYKYFTLITGFFVAVILISNVASSKILDLGPFTFDGGTIIFPLSYILGNILTEVYGYRKARQVIWIGFSCALMMSLVFAVVGWLPPSPEWGNQEAYTRILGTTPRIVAGSMLAFFAGGFSNAILMSRLKVLTRGRWLFSRTISSTAAGQAVDTAFFVLIAFGGIFSWSTLGAIMISNYVFKVCFEVVLTPVNYAVINFLKQAEKSDVYDYKTSLNPFVWPWKSSSHSGDTTNSDIQID